VLSFFILRQEQGTFVIAALDQPRQDFTPAPRKLQELVCRFFNLTAKNLLTEGASLYAPQTQIKSKADESIVLTCGKTHRKKSGDPSFKSDEISTKESIYFVFRKSTVVIRFQRVSVSLIQW
jgi:hypothetical protein